MYIKQAETVGRIMAENHIELVYGGGRVGVMGALADGVLAHHGKAIGVIPEKLMTLEVGHTGLSELYVVDSMHTRKAHMYDLSDAFLVLPGGMGTLDEMFEILTWSQLKLHHKPIYLLNEFGFYDSLLDHLKKSADAGFIKTEHVEMLRVLKKPEDLVSIFKN